MIPLCRGLVKYAGCKKGCTQDNANPNDENLTWIAQKTVNDLDNLFSELSLISDLSVWGQSQFKKFYSNHTNDLALAFRNAR